MSEQWHAVPSAAPFTTTDNHTTQAHSQRQPSVCLKRPAWTLLLILSRGVLPAPQRPGAAVLIDRGLCRASSVTWCEYCYWVSWDWDATGIRMPGTAPHGLSGPANGARTTRCSARVLL